MMNIANAVIWLGRKVLPFYLLTFLPFTGFAQELKVEFVTPTIVHIVKGQPTKSLVVTAKPEQVAVTRQGNTYKSSELTVKQDAQGNLTFLTAKGKVLLREKNCDISKVQQVFTLDKDEAIYGNQQPESH